MLSTRTMSMISECCYAECRYGDCRGAVSEGFLNLYICDQRVEIFKKGGHQEVRKWSVAPNVGAIWSTFFVRIL